MTAHVVFISFFSAPPLPLLKALIICQVGRRKKKVTLKKNYSCHLFWYFFMFFFLCGSDCFFFSFFQVISIEIIFLFRIQWKEKKIFTPVFLEQTFSSSRIISLFFFFLFSKDHWTDVKVMYISENLFLHLLFSSRALACYQHGGAVCHTDVWTRTCEQHSQKECPQCLSLWPEFCDDRQFYKQLGINQSPLEICHLPLLH